MVDKSENLTAEYRHFGSGWDFAHFHRLIKASPDFVEVPALKPFAHGTYTQHWYRHLPSGKVYRLVEPGEYFRGRWEIVPDEELQEESI